MSDFSKFEAQDARLIVLRALSDDTDGRMNEVILLRILDTFGHRRSRDWLRTQLRHMEELGAIKNSEAGSVFISQILQLGQDHVERRAIIEGIARPSPEA